MRTIIFIWYLKLISPFLNAFLQFLGFAKKHMWFFCGGRRWVGWQQEVCGWFWGGGGHSSGWQKSADFRSLEVDISWNVQIKTPPKVIPEQIIIISQNSHKGAKCVIVNIKLWTISPLDEARACHLFMADFGPEFWRTADDSKFYLFIICSDTPNISIVSLTRWLFDTNHVVRCQIFGVSLRQLYALGSQVGTVFYIYASHLCDNRVLVNLNLT